MTSLNLVQKYFTSIKNLENQRRRKNHPGKAKQAKALMVLVLGNSVISEPTETSKFLYHSLLQNYPRTTITDQANEVGKRTDEVLQLPTCRDLPSLLNGHWQPQPHLIKKYSSELEREGSLWRLDKGMPEVYYSNKINTCGYGQQPVSGQKYKGNMWCNPHDKSRSCCLDHFCQPSDQCDANKQDISNVNFFENQPIDFSDFTWPELSEWKANSCQFIPRNSEQSCGVLKNNKAGIRKIYFVGDSLTLNYYIGFVTHLLGDYKFGPLEPFRKNSTCSDGFQNLLYKREDCRVIPESKYLENFGCENVEIKFIDIRNNSRIDQVQTAISLAKSDDSLKNSLFVINAGTHEKFRFELVVKKVLEPVIDLLPRKNLLWISQVRPSFNVPLKYNRKQSAWLRMREFYQKIATWTDENKVNRLDLHAISANAFSPDGTHYSMGVQLMKAQVLLQYIENMVEMEFPKVDVLGLRKMRRRERLRKRREVESSIASIKL